MPAEWQPHRSTWLAWPNDPFTWARSLEQTENTFIEMVRWLSSDEEVHLLVRDISEERKVKKQLIEAGMGRNVFFHKIKTKSVWIRDYGPTFVRSGKNKLVSISWKFNAWGGKYKSLIEDGFVSKKIAKLAGLKTATVPIVLEGGSIDVNGVGDCLTTEECLLNRNRNPELHKQDVEKYLEKYLGVRRVIWLKRGMKGDDTDGHVDCMARFVSKDTIVSVYSNDKTDKNYKILEENWKCLQTAQTSGGKKFNLVKLPAASGVRLGRRQLPASYANFYIGNKAVLVPTFAIGSDVRALGILTELFAGRKVVGIDCRTLLYGLGAIHCATQQEPKI